MKLKQKFSVGDKVVVTATGAYFYSVGDYGIVFNIDSEGYIWVDFNDSRNGNVYEEGKWCSHARDLRLESKQHGKQNKAVIYVRCSPADAELIKLAAKDCRSVSQWARVNLVKLATIQTGESS